MMHKTNDQEKLGFAKMIEFLDWIQKLFLSKTNMYISSIGTNDLGRWAIGKIQYF